MFRLCSPNGIDVQDELPLLTCPYCQSPAKRVLEKEVLPTRFPNRWVWICSRFPACDARVGCHPNTVVPLGHLANKELRDLRSAVHRLFDPLWIAKMKRDHIHKYHARRLAYEWLAREMSLPRSKCHVAMFNVDQCHQALAILEPYKRKRA